MTMLVGPTPPRKLEKMYAHTGECEDCKGPVKMMRDKASGDLLFHACWCLCCGQTYFMQIEDKEAWEKEQWRQKSDSENDRRRGGCFYYNEELSVKPLLAFHGDRKIKRMYLDRVIQHEKLDEIIKGIYWENGKGCAVGCTIHSSDHLAYESELGIPIILAKIEDLIFERLPLALAKTWPKRFLKAIYPGADLSFVWDEFASRLLTDPIGGVIQYAKREEQIEAIQRVSDLYEARLAGLIVDRLDFKDAAASVASACDAASSASVAAYVASVAYACDAAAYAFDAAADAGREKAYIFQSEMLLEILRKTK